MPEIYGKGPRVGTLPCAPLVKLRKERINMIIELNEVIEDKLDELEDAFMDLVNVHTNIWDGSLKDSYKYEIEIDENPTTAKKYDLEHVNVLYKNGSYMIEIMNAAQVSMVEIKPNEILSILIK